jgi:cytoskeletal protein CcmA (bactofilin family)
MCAWRAVSRAMCALTGIVVVGGELQGNIESAKRVDVLEGGVIVGDVKAGSITVAAGSRMRGHVEFGWEDEKGKIKGLVSNGS